MSSEPRPGPSSAKQKIISYTSTDFVLVVISVVVPVFRIHERNLDMARRRRLDRPSAQHIQLDLQSLCAKFPGEDDSKTSDVMSLKDPLVNILISQLR
jgi:hypothetical protein